MKNQLFSAPAPVAGPIGATPVLDADPQARRVGIGSAVAAFTIWGSLPLYWTQIAHVPSLEIILHRVFWGGLLAWLIVGFRRVRRCFDGRRVATPPVPLIPRGRVLSWLLLNGVLVVVNWLVYVWAVSNGRTLDASLGYYINPLVSVFLGMVFLGERLTRLQWTALGSATAGVLFLTLRLGVFPWISLALAFTFGIYGLIKKRTELASIHSLAVELTPLMLVTAVVLVVQRGNESGGGHFLTGDPVVSLYLGGAGLVTVLPLLLFGVAARRIRLADVGFLQYIAPTMMFVVAVAIFGDPLEPARLLGFGFVWLGLALYTMSNFYRVSRRKQAGRE